MSFAGKAVLITGGTGGIGQAIARAFLDRGALVALGGRSESAYWELSSALACKFLYPALGDIETRAGCQAVVADALQAMGGLDILVNAAGFYQEAPFEETDEALWDRTMNINLRGSYFTAQAALPVLRARRGNIVNIASESGLIAYPNATAYCAAKGAVVNLTRALAQELVPEVRVNCICPGNIETEMIGRAARASGDPEAYLAMSRGHAPLGRMGTPEEVAGAVLYFASDQAGFTTGAVLAVDGGTLAG